jgi:CTP:molybdopterin cytidylyltransferase MocA
MSVAGVILAAGAGTRFNGADADATPGAKLLVSVKGVPLVVAAITPALAAGLDELIVVEGAVSLAEVVPDGVRLLRNDEWECGQVTSLRVAIDWCAHQGHQSVVVGLGDLPGLTVAAWRAVAEAPGGPIVFATYGGRRGHPVRLDSEVWPLLPLDGDVGARALAGSRPELVTEVACDGNTQDIDTREDLRRWS